MPQDPSPRRPPRQALTEEERVEVLAALHTDRFVDKSPWEIYATLLDEGTYLCSVRTMYRLLTKHGEARERRDVLTHPAYRKPQLLATGPNQVWSWDITKLLGAEKWTSFPLYVILDIFSRYVVGWMVASRENAGLAERLIRQTCEKEAIPAVPPGGPHQLTIHADNGGTMIAKPVALLLADLGVIRSHSRPHTSDDNPFSEAQFKTLKYRPDFPDRFGSLQDARAFCHRFFIWYNQVHHHSGLAMLTPDQVHHGRSKEVIAARQIVLESAYRGHPDRFAHLPVLKGPPTAVWINPPTKSQDSAQ